MDKAKIDDAVLVMQRLSVEERAVVNYTVDREGKKRTRKSKAADAPPISTEPHEE